MASRSTIIANAGLRHNLSLARGDGETRDGIINENKFFPFQLIPELPHHGSDETGAGRSGKIRLVAKVFQEGPYNYGTLSLGQ
jgi:hypothetical protein